LKILNHVIICRRKTTRKYTVLGSLFEGGKTPSFYFLTSTLTLLTTEDVAKFRLVFCTVR